MFKALVLTATAVLLAPGVASAATATAHVRVRGGVTVGPVTFAGARGEANRLTITTAGGLIVFRDRAQPVVARGDCRRVDRHTARCPFTEDIAQARLGDGRDRATLRGGLVQVHGGPGADVLIGTGGSGLFGEGGDDTLRGARGGDELNGGPGRDVVAGGAGDDVFVDGETDGQAARDVYIGGPSLDTRNADRGDVLSYARRSRGVRVDLGRGTTSTEDRIVGLESLIGGRGNDRLIGDGDDNNLEGGPGADLLRGRGGRDIPLGGPGDDRAFGDAGDDVVWGDEGRDRLSGGDGADLVVSLEEQRARRPTSSRAGPGATTRAVTAATR